MLKEFELTIEEFNEFKELQSDDIKSEFWIRLGTKYHFEPETAKMLAEGRSFVANAESSQKRKARLEKQREKIIELTCTLLKKLGFEKRDRSYGTPYYVYTGSKNGISVFLGYNLEIIRNVHPYKTNSVHVIFDKELEDMTFEEVEDAIQKAKDFTETPPSLDVIYTWEDSYENPPHVVLVRNLLTANGFTREKHDGNVYIRTEFPSMTADLRYSWLRIMVGEDGYGWKIVSKLIIDVSVSEIQLLLDKAIVCASKCSNRSDDPVVEIQPRIIEDSEICTKLSELMETIGYRKLEFDGALYFQKCDKSDSSKDLYITFERTNIMISTGTINKGILKTNRLYSMNKKKVSFEEVKKVIEGYTNNLTY